MKIIIITNYSVRGREAAEENIIEINLNFNYFSRSFYRGSSLLAIRLILCLSPMVLLSLFAPYKLYHFTNVDELCLAKEWEEEMRECFHSQYFSPSQVYIYSNNIKLILIRIAFTPKSK